MHYLQHLHNIENFITSIRLDLENVNDNKVTAIRKLKQLDLLINELRKSFNDYTEKQKIENTMFCDILKIEFSINSDFSNSYTRKYEGVCLSMETLKTIIYGERMLQNDSDDLLFARVFIEDTDPEA